MTQFRIRLLLEQDAPVIAALTHELGYDIGPSFIQKQAHQILGFPDHLAFVAEREGEILGYIHAIKAIRLTTPPFVEIVALAVSEKARRLGIGKALVQKVEETDLGTTSIRVRCNVIRESAHQFYESLGFVLKKEQKVFIKKRS